MIDTTVPPPRGHGARSGAAGTARAGRGTQPRATPRATAAPRAAADATPAKARAQAGRHGWLHLVFPAMLMLAALAVLLSGRNLSENFLDLARESESLVQVTRHPVLAWVQRGVSVLLLLASIERIASHFLQRRPVHAPVLTLAFLTFWLCTVASPGLLGATPLVSHEYAYSLLFGLAATLTLPDDRERILRASRTGLFVYMLAGIAVIPVMPDLVLDASYTQGFLPGVPRFGGLASHPVMMGLLAQTALLLLWARPFRYRWLTVAGWTLGLAVLVVAQSKTAWLAFLLSVVCMVAVRRFATAGDRLGDTRDNSFGILLCLAVIVAAVGVLLGTLVVDVPGLVDDFFNTAQGAQLASMTGRDRIWVVAMEEFHSHPVFGFGPTLWDAEYRQAIGMPNATHGHNQFIDTLARSGLVGLLGLVVWFLALLVLSLRHARASGGLSLAMFATLALLCISEVPLLLSGYGTDLFTHLLLVVVLAGCAAERPRAAPVRVAPLEPSHLRAHP